MKQQDIRAEVAAPDNKIAQSAMHESRFATPRPVGGQAAPRAASKPEEESHD